MRDGIPDEVVESTHGVSVQVESVRGDEVLADDLPLFSGVLDVTYDNNVPALLDLRFPPDLMPRSPFDPLAPFGQRLRLSQVLAVGPEEHPISLGEYLVTETRLEDGQTVVRAQGLEYLVLDARLTSPFKPSSTYAATLRALCRGIIDVDVNPALADRSLASSVTEEWADDEERMNLLRSLERSWPATFVVDDDGILVAKPRPTVGTPVRSWVHGEASAYVTVGVGATREEVYNAYVQKYEKPDGTPDQQWAFDNDPASPTYYYGPYGQRPRFAFAPGITTAAQALSAARAGLRRELRRTTRITVDAPPDPRVETWDTVAVTLEDGQTFTGLVTDIGLPLTAGDGPARYIIGEVASWL